MGYFSDLETSIIEMFHDGMSPSAIADSLSITNRKVTSILDAYQGGEYDEDVADQW